MIDFAAALPAIALLLLGPAALVIAYRRWPNRVARIRSVALGIAVTLGGAVMLFNQLDANQRAAEGRNPVAADARSIEAGRALYQRHCEECHGVGGRGDGPRVRGITPPPADLTIHVPLLPDRFVFAKIGDGVPDTAMAAWSKELRDRDIWDVVNYLRTMK